MKYMVEMNRPKIDDEILEMPLDSRAEVADFVVGLISLSFMTDPEFKVLEHSTDPENPELYVNTTSGYIRAYPISVQ